MVTAFVISSGEETLGDCLEALSRVRGISKTVMIENVSPCHEAFNRQLDLCDTERFVQVEADVIPFEDSVERLIELDAPISIGYLWGDLENRPIHGFRMFETEVAKLVRFPDDPRCDKWHIHALEGLGHRKVIAKNTNTIDGCFGIHRSLYSVRAARKRVRNLMGGWGRHPESMAWIFPMLETVRKNGGHVHMEAYDEALKCARALGMKTLPKTKKEAFSL